MISPPSERSERWGSTGEAGEGGTPQATLLVAAPPPDLVFDPIPPRLTGCAMAFT